MEPYNFILPLVTKAGDLLISLREKEFDVFEKGGDSKDIVTSVDLNIEKFLMDEIKNKFPDDGIYSEESASTESVNARQWVIDPIDGSSNFSRGIPHFSVCIGLLENSIPIVGAVYNPVTNELFSFERGKGAFLNNQSINVSDIDELARAYIFFHAGRKENVREWGGESYRRLLGGAKKTSNMSASALDICFVAAGRIEANIYGTLSTLDIAPALGILYEAGGVASDASGDRVKLSAYPQKIFMANNKKILADVRGLLE